MPKKQTEPKYPRELFVAKDSDGVEEFFYSYASLNEHDVDTTEVAVHQLVHIGKVKRTVTVE